MPTSEQDRAELSKKRAQAASYISDVPEKQKFVAAQGEAEKKSKTAGVESDEDYNKLSREADDTIATQGANKAVGVASYKHGTSHVPKTGLAMLHKGEAVIPAKDNPYAGMEDILGGKPAAKPEKKLKEIHLRKGHKKGYIAEHHFHAPHDAREHMEEHPIAHQDHMVDHMLEHMGESNPGEAEADKGMSGIEGE